MRAERGLDEPPAARPTEGGVVCATPGCDRPPARYKRLCPACRMREWRAKHRVESRAHEAARTFTDEQTAVRRARAYISTMVRRGKIARGTCSVCGDGSNVSPTWRDPLRPLDVRWLCRDHVGEARVSRIELQSARAKVRSWLTSIRAGVAALSPEERAALNTAFAALLGGRDGNAWALAMSIQAVANYLGGRVIIVDGAFRLGSRAPALEPRERVAAALREIHADP